MPTYEFPCQTARTEPSPEVGAYLASLGDPAGIERFFGVFADTVALRPSSTRRPAR